jgi:hypothetical protein
MAFPTRIRISHGGPKKDGWWSFRAEASAMPAKLHA